MLHLQHVHPGCGCIQPAGRAHVDLMQGFAPVRGRERERTCSVNLRCRESVWWYLERPQGLPQFSREVLSEFFPVVIEGTASKGSGR